MSLGTSGPGAPLPTLRRVALIAALSILLVQFIPGQGDALEAATTPFERYGVAAAWGAYGLLMEAVGVFRRRAGVIFEVLLYATGAWTIRIAVADGYSAGSVLSLVMSTFTLGLGFRDAERLARFYLFVLGGVAVTYAIAPPNAGMEPTLVLAVLGTIMTIAYLVARARDQALAEASVLALVASRVHNGVMMTDARGRVVWINDGFTRMSGLALPQVLGRDLADLLRSPPTPAAEIDRLRRAIAAGQPLQMEAARLRPDGTALWLALDLTPVHGEDGAVERFVAIETDVSAAHQYVAEIQDAMSDLLLVVYPDGTIRSANRAACERLGVGPDELVGRSFVDFLAPIATTTERPSSPDDPPSNVSDGAARRLMAAVADRYATLPTQGVEIGLRRSNGTVVAVHLTTSDLPPQGDLPRRTVLVARDISERRRLDRERSALEKKARQAQQLESLGVLAGGIAHDFNNLLVGVLGNASLLREELPPNPSLATLVDRIEQAAQRAAELTRQMLAYSGRGRFVVEPIDLSVAVEEMRRLVAAAMSKRAVVKLELGTRLPLVEGDVTQIRQILMNLLTNASDALEGKDGTILIRTGVVDADRATLATDSLDDDLPSGKYVFVEVSDTGVGMTEAVRRRMFDPFFTTKETGRGLGLSAALGIVRGHRGTIRVASSPGKGTKITILLPASDREADVRTPVNVTRPVALRGARVLVADDEPAVLDFVTQVLRTTGAEVVAVADGQAAVDAFAATPDAFDLVILDLTMPRLNGDETLAELRRLRPEVRVLLSSGYSEQEAFSRYGADGLAGFLQKPYRAKQLLTQIRPLLGVPDPTA